MHQDTGEMIPFDTEEKQAQAHETLNARLKQEMYTQAKQRLEGGEAFIPLTEDLASELLPLSRKVRKNTMRNKPCICGSGRKFKRCCWGRFSSPILATGVKP